MTRFHGGKMRVITSYLSVTVFMQNATTRAQERVVLWSNFTFIPLFDRIFCCCEIASETASKFK